MTSEKVKILYQRSQMDRTGCRLKRSHTYSLCVLKAFSWLIRHLTKFRTQGVGRASNCALAASGLHRIQDVLPKSLLHPEDGPWSYPCPGRTQTVHLWEAGKYFLFLSQGLLVTMENEEGKGIIILYLTTLHLLVFSCLLFLLLEYIS